MTLLDELTTGPLAAELAPYIASGATDAIHAAFHRKNIQSYGKISVGVFADWLAITGLRANVEDHAANPNSPLRANALSILDLLRGSHDYQIDFGEASKQALLNAWVTNGDITAEQQTALLNKAKISISRAEQVGIDVTETDIRREIWNDDGSRKL